MTSVVPERAAARATLEVTPSPRPAPAPPVARRHPLAAPARPPTAPARRPGRRPWRGRWSSGSRLLGPVPAREPSRIAVPRVVRPTSSSRRTSWSGRCWPSPGSRMLVATRTYDGRVLGVGGDEYRRVARASVYFWGLVAIASYMIAVRAVALRAGRSRSSVGHLPAAARPLGRPQGPAPGPPPLHPLVAPGARRRRPRRGRRAGRRARARAVRRAEGGRCLHAARRRRRRRSVPVVGSLTSVPEAVARLGVDTVAVTASRGLTSGVLKRLGWDLEGAGVDLVVAPGPDRRRRPAGARPPGLRPAAAVRRAAGVHRPDLGDEGGLRPRRWPRWPSPCSARSSA